MPDIPDSLFPLADLGIYPCTFAEEIALSAEPRNVSDTNWNELE